MKNFTIILHDISFERVDDDGNPEVDEQGNVIVYEAIDCDYSWVAESFNDYGEEQLAEMLTPVEEQCAREVAVETAKKIKQKLIREAIDMTLDLDFTQLNFDDIIDEVANTYIGNLNPEP